MVTGEWWQQSNIPHGKNEQKRPKLEKGASSSVEGGICGSGNGAKKPDNDDVRLVTDTSRGLAAASLVFNYADDDNMNEEAVCSSVM